MLSDILISLVTPLVRNPRGGWARRIAALLLWIGIGIVGHALIERLHSGQTASFLLSMGVIVLASVVADYVGGSALVPTPGMVGALGVGLVSGVLGGHVIATHSHLGALSTDICLYAGMVLGLTVAAIIYVVAIVRASVRQGSGDISVGLQ